MPTCSACRQYDDRVTGVVIGDTRIAGLCYECKDRLYGDSEKKYAKLSED